MFLHWDNLEPELVDLAIEAKQLADKRSLLSLGGALRRARERSVVDRSLETGNQNRRQLPRRRVEVNFAFPEMQAFRVNSESRCRTPRSTMFAESPKTVVDFSIGRIRGQPFLKCLGRTDELCRACYEAERWNAQCPTARGPLTIAGPLEDRDAIVRTQITQHLPLEGG